MWTQEVIYTLQKTTDIIVTFDIFELSTQKHLVMSGRGSERQVLNRILVLYRSEKGDFLWFLSRTDPKALRFPRAPLVLNDRFGVCVCVIAL